MRNVIVLGLACSALVLSSVACSDGTTTGSSRRSGYVPAAGEPTTHDPNDVDESAGPDTGNPNADAPPPAPTGAAGQSSDEVGVTLSSATPAVDLGATVTLDVSVAAKGTFTGNVDLSVTGLPAGVTATFAPASVTAGAAPITSKLTLTSAFTAIPSAPNQASAIQIVAKTAKSQATAPANMKVNPKATLTIPMNVDALRAANVGTVYHNEWGTTFGTTPQPLQTQEGNGIVFVVKNADSTAHIVHSGGAFPHGDTARPIAPNQFETLADGTVRTRTLSPTAATPINVAGYPHDGANGPSVSFQIKVNAVK